MYPGRFEYFAPATLDDALSTLDRLGEGAKVLAGGQSLIPLMKLRFAAPEALVDINGVPGLDGMEVEDGELRIGALVRTADCERSELLRGRFGVLADAAPQISDPIVRNRGTLAGSLAHADPQGDWASALMVADARVMVRGGGDGARELAVEDLIEGPFTPALEPNELITEVRVPDPGPRSAGTYLKLERKVGDFATAAVAVQLTLSNGTVERAGIALTGVTSRNERVPAAEEALVGRAPDEEAIGDAARLAAEASDPRTDVRGSAEYKRHVVRVFTERALRTAAQRAGEE